MTRSNARSPGYSLWQMAQYMATLGTIGFGGLVALVGYMHRDLVEQRKWSYVRAAEQAARQQR